MNRIDRLSAILVMLQSSSAVQTKDIADRFNISLRTVYRDLKALDETGIPIAGGAKEGYSLVEGFKLPPLMFTQEEAFAFLAAERLVDRFTDTGFKAGYKSGVDKIRAVMRLSEKEKMESLDAKIESLDFHYYDSYSSRSTLQLLMNEIIKKRRIRITYFSYDKQETTVREIDPIGIFFSLANWYLIAYCHMKHDYRTFRVSRIQHVALTEKYFEMDHPPFNSFLESLSGRKNLHAVVIEVNKANFSLIDESKYYQGLVNEKEIGDKMELHFMVFSIERFARWYLSFIDIAKIVLSEELKIQVDKILFDAGLKK